MPTAQTNRKFGRQKNAHPKEVADRLGLTEQALASARFDARDRRMSISEAGSVLSAGRLRRRVENLDAADYCSDVPCKKSRRHAPSGKAGIRAPSPAANSGLTHSGNRHGSGARLDARASLRMRVAATVLTVSRTSRRPPLHRRRRPVSTRRFRPPARPGSLRQLSPFGLTGHEPRWAVINPHQARL